MNIQFDGKHNQSFKWYGRYRGIGWSIVARKSYDQSSREFDWCHYIHLNLNQVPENMREEFWLPPKKSEMSVSKRKYVHYDYSSSLIADLEWHVGCTYYERNGSIETEDRWIKAGCDYMHLWDEGKYYDMEYVLQQVEDTIDSLHRKVKGIGIHCWHGYCAEEYHLETEGIYNEDKSSFICFYCEGKRVKELKEKELEKSNAK